MFSTKIINTSKYNWGVTNIAKQIGLKQKQKSIHVLHVQLKVGNADAYQTAWNATIHWLGRLIKYSYSGRVHTAVYTNNVAIPS